MVVFFPVWKQALLETYPGLPYTSSTTMKFALSKEHKRFFREEGSIEFEGLFSPISIDFDSDPEGCFLAGRDLFRQNRSLRTLVTKRQIASVAAELCQTAPLRIAFDQLIVTSNCPKPDSFQSSAFETLTHQPTSLKDLSSFQGLRIGLILCLESVNALEGLPTRAGSGLFVAPDHILPFDKLYDSSPNTYLLVGFCENRTVYISKKRDPHNHCLKQLGYVFGDRLKESTHPTVVKEF